MGLSLGRRNGVLAHHPIMLGINNHQETSLISNVYRLFILIIQYKAFSLSLSSCAASLGTVAQYKLLCSNRKLWTDAVQAAGADRGGEVGGGSGGWGLAETDGKDANGLKQKQKKQGGLLHSPEFKCRWKVDLSSPPDPFASSKPHKEKALAKQHREYRKRKRITQPVATKSTTFLLGESAR